MEQNPKTNQKNNKKSNIIELIVIIIIILLCAIGIFIMFKTRTNVGNISIQIQLIQNLNSALDKDSDVHYNMTDAMKCARKAGYIVDRLNASYSFGIELLWDSKNDCFCYLDEENKIKYIPNTTCKYSIADGTMIESDYWQIVDSVDKVNNSDNKYSKYLKGTDVSGKIEVSVGFDAGETNGITDIVYNNPGDSNKIVIRSSTFNTRISINTSSDIISHYGFSSEIVIEDTNSGTYYEYGKVGRLKVNKGNVVIKDNAEIYCLMDINLGSSDIKLSPQAIIHKETSKNISEDTPEINTLGIYQGEMHECGVNNHASFNMVIDQYNIYYVCPACGYSLYRDSTGINASTTSVFSNGNVVSTDSIDMNCAHKNITYFDMGTNHSGICSDCSVRFNANHSFNDDGICRYCSHSQAEFGTIVIKKGNNQAEMTQACYCGETDFVVTITDTNAFLDGNDKIIIYINAVKEDQNNDEIFSIVIGGKVYFYQILVEGMKKGIDYSMMNIYIKDAKEVSYGGIVFGWDNVSYDQTLEDYAGNYYAIEKVYLKTSN